MLKEKVVVITGGAGLIGQEFVKTVIENEGVAVIADVNEDLANKVRNQLVQSLSSENIDYVKMDITSKRSILSAIEYLNKKYKRIDALVNSAFPRNKNYGKHFFDVDYDDFTFHLNMNLGGYFLTSQQFAKFFRSQGHGNIINIASIYGVVPPKFEIYEGTDMTSAVEYSGIKAGLIHLTKYMAKYFKGMNIRVNLISPGGIFDHQNELFLEAYKEKCLNKGMLDNSDLNGTLLYLLSDMSKYVNGQNIIVDDGFTL